MDNVIVLDPFSKTTSSESDTPLTIKRALISVSDKKGIIEFAKALKEFGVEIISTGGTFTTLKNAGIAGEHEHRHEQNNEARAGYQSDLQLRPPYFAALRHVYSRRLTNFEI